MRYIRDDEFIRGDCPMTKEEIRILSIARMELEEDYNVLDIGAGTGSISIQASKICNKGNVTAIEREHEAFEVLSKNKEKFSAANLEIREGDALIVEPDIEGMFDAIFVGGSGGNIREIIKKYSLKLKKGRMMVLNFITIDNLYKTMEVLRELGFEIECTMTSISKTRGESYMLLSNNPIFILSGRKMAEDVNG
jgi:cobalt-precorrin-6B (C15)-methyltransferase